MQKRIFSLLILFIFAISGCQNDCKKIDCVHGSCQDGECLCEIGWQKDENGLCTKPIACASGYELDSLGACSIKGIQKFLGEWRGAEDCTPSNGSHLQSTYNLIFSAHPSDSTKIIIENIGNLDCTSGQTLVVEGTLQRDTNGKYTVVSNFSPQCTVPNFDIKNVSWYNQTITIRFWRTFNSINDGGYCDVVLTKI